MMGFAGVKIIKSVHATEEVWRWPIKKRSRRLVKKMTKKYGVQIYRKPCIIMTPQAMIVHPDLMPLLLAKTQEAAP